MTAARRSKRSLGNSWLAPPRFVLFAVLLVLGVGRRLPAAFTICAHAIMAASISPRPSSCSPARPCSTTTAARCAEHSAQNDANRVVLLVITGGDVAVILVAVGAELTKAARWRPIKALIIGTLALAWLFSNIVYALHYAHLFYKQDEGAAAIAAGSNFPAPKEPDYWDFIYFSFTLGMTFQTSDTDITDDGDPPRRRSPTASPPSSSTSACSPSRSTCWAGA